jgi:hypothetical protein
LHAVLRIKNGGKLLNRGRRVLLWRNFKDCDMMAVV